MKELEERDFEEEGSGSTDGDNDENDDPRVFQPVGKKKIMSHEKALTIKSSMALRSVANASVKFVRTASVM
ncbi:hypothetical protein PPTG_24911 [Phytophthora nicotianae INRA-310]|uniref:Uncharacterized protein n=1 Tax=Phytophthora nicotianae (strain INRA-310) TaxID=761204 RepID=W2PA62_PHYN3|nr:hypothetical protein PPTG_24911 [Phytophthora nicotianae INRA-310]ETM97550.1 hypothetical protein PPTG_24911 [Phytophthora nicotianae INRA-310]